MVFTSWSFVIFFCVVLIGLRLLRGRTERQCLLLIASIVFYAYWKVAYIALLATPSLIDFVCSKRIESTGDRSTRRFWLLVSLLTNLGLLAYFKYVNFFLETIASVLGTRPKHLDILLPIGISFYTFKTLSYTIDVYRRQLPACRSLWRYAVFVTYFPELIAGPIVRASVFLPQMTRSLKLSWPRTVIGMQLILLGFTKKLGIADRIAPFVDRVFQSPDRFTPTTVSFAVIAYSLQIYCDFSGYSDMAIGISKIIGFDLPENFNMPYLSTSVTEFWRRWHITLSLWLRDYLYIPLGGNRHGRLRTYLNLLLTMLLGGLWHGANWTFVFWGFLHGAGLAVHKFWIEQRGPRTQPSAIGKFLGWLATYVFVCFAWVFFRSPSFAVAISVFKKLLWLAPGGVQWIYSPLLMILPLVAFGHGIGVLAHRQLGINVGFGPAPQWAEAFYKSSGKQRFAIKPHKAAGVYFLLPLENYIGAIAFTFWIILALLSANINSQPFIYFQF